MDSRTLAILASSSVGSTRVACFAQSLPSAPPARARCLSAYEAAGDLLLPKNFHDWIYVGSPLTPNDGPRREASKRECVPGSFKVASTKKDEIWTQFHPLFDK